MSVVRSVQELANELEATSKTVTAGKYSVFNELRDHRKQEKILNLGGGDNTDNSEADNDATEVERSDDGESQNEGSQEEGNEQS